MTGLETAADPATAKTVLRHVAGSAARAVGRDVGGVLKLFGRLGADGLYRACPFTSRKRRRSGDEWDRDLFSVMALIVVAVAIPVAAATFGGLLTAGVAGAGYVATSAARRHAAERTTDKKTGTRGPVRVRKHERHLPGGRKIAVSYHSRAKARN